MRVECLDHIQQQYQHLPLQLGSNKDPHLPTLAVILSAVVMYDASGVRLHAGRQAELLNQIVCELPPEHPLSNARPLRELLGHTPPQVAAGAVLGCIVSYLMTSSVVSPLYSSSLANRSRKRINRSQLSPFTLFVASLSKGNIVAS